MDSAVPSAWHRSRSPTAARRISGRIPPDPSWFFARHWVAGESPMKVSVVAALLLASTSLLSAPAGAQRYNEVDLVSDLSGRALNTDSHLQNPWGLVPGPTGVFWVSNNKTSTSTLYDPDGTAHSLVVNIPGGAP